ncbi:hypothetical protein IG631_05873 [Alternaria alternata]|nr:hypothetical protein IG631_05873 [Alternaria alternata]
MNDRLMFSLVGELKKKNCATVPIVFSRSQAQQPVVRWQGYYALAVQITTDTGQEREYPELQLTDHTPGTLSGSYKRRQGRSSLSHNDLSYSFVTRYYDRLYTAYLMIITPYCRRDA